MLGQTLQLDKHSLQTLETICRDLQEKTFARAVFLFDINGKPVVEAGQLEQLDRSSIGSLIAGAQAAGDGLADLLGEERFVNQFHEGSQNHLHITRIDTDLLLAVFFGTHTNLGLVRLQTSRALEKILEAVDESDQISPDLAVSEIFGALSDDEIGALVDDAFYDEEA